MVGSFFFMRLDIIVLIVSIDYLLDHQSEIIEWIVNEYIIGIESLQKKLLVYKSSANNSTKQFKKLKNS